MKLQAMREIVNELEKYKPVGHEVSFKHFDKGVFRELIEAVLNVADSPRECAFRSVELFDAMREFYINQLVELRSYYEKREDISQLIQRVETLIARIEYDSGRKGQSNGEAGTSPIQDS